MAGGQIVFFVIMGLMVLVTVATIIDNWWRGHKENKKGGDS